MIFIFLSLLLLVALLYKFLTSDGMYTEIICIHLHVNCELTLSIFNGGVLLLPFFLLKFDFKFKGISLWCQRGMQSVKKLKIRWKTQFKKLSFFIFFLDFLSISYHNLCIVLKHWSVCVCICICFVYLLHMIFLGCLDYWSQPWNRYGNSHFEFLMYFCRIWLILIHSLGFHFLWSEIT